MTNDKKLNELVDSLCKNDGAIMAGLDGDCIYQERLYCDILGLYSLTIGNDCSVEEVEHAVKSRGLYLDGIVEAYVTGTYPCIDEIEDLSDMNYEMCEDFLECLNCTFRGFAAYKSIHNMLWTSFRVFFGKDIKPENQPSYAYDHPVEFIKMVLNCVDYANMTLDKYGLGKLNKKDVLIHQMYIAHLISYDDYCSVRFNIKAA